MANFFFWNCYLFVYSLYFVSAKIIPDLDSFIVDADVDNKEPVKKRFLQSSANVGSMALGFTPKSNPASEVKKHIEPAISLEKSLKHLDIVGDKRGILPKPKTETLKNITSTTTDSIVQESEKNNRIISNRTTPTVSREVGGRKKNILTNSTILGFFAKDPNYTISMVGKPQEREVKKKNQEEGDNEKRISGDSNQMLDAIKTHLINTTDMTNRNLNEFTESVHNEKAILEEANMVSSETQLHMVNPSDFLRFPVETKLVDNEKQENAVKKEEIESHSPLHEIECSDKKKCPKNKYCRHFHCYEGHRKHHECHEDDQCIDDMFCIYGRCDDKKKGSPGSVCIKDGDCGDGCCVLEPTITEEHGICKAKLKEFHQCAPVLFRKVWLGDKPKCGPCEDGLECVERGVRSSHLVCMKKK